MLSSEQRKVAEKVEKRIKLTPEEEKGWQLIKKVQEKVKLTLEEKIFLQLLGSPWKSEIEKFDSANKTGVGVKRKIRDSTRLMYVRLMARFAKHMKKPIQELTKEDVKNYIASLDNKFTVRHTCAVMKKFLVFAGRKDLAKKISVPNISIDERIDEIDRVTPGEVQKLLQAEDNPRNQALIAVLYESSGRLSEVSSLKVRDVQIDKYGAIVKLFGKTRLRNVRLVASAPYLTRWLQIHSCRGDPEAPLFYAIYLGKTKGLGNTMIAKIIRSAAKRAGFKGEQLKKFHPHAFRHGRLSELGHDLTDSEMKHVGGWNDRRMISLYSRVDEDRVNNKLLSLQGLTVEEEKKVSELHAKQCPRCRTLNAEQDLYCSLCGLPLTLQGQKEAESLETLKEEISELKNQMLYVNTVFRRKPMPHRLKPGPAEKQLENEGFIVDK